MRMMRRRRRRERGTVLLVVVVFLAMAIAGLAAISSGRVVYATRSQRVMEEETRAFHSAYAQIHMAMNVVNTSAYDEENNNLALRDAVAGLYGGTPDDDDDSGDVDPKKKKDKQRENALATAEHHLAKYAEKGNENHHKQYEKHLAKAGGIVVTETGKPDTVRMAWLDDPEDIGHGLIEGTSVRVYRARDYVVRLRKLRGEQVTEVDPEGLSDSYFVLEAAGRMGDTVRLVSALVRENEPFSSFVFFQNRATLGVSGAPRGLIHSNGKVAFYLPGGYYADSVSAVEGFDFLAGATPENTRLRDANPASQRIELEKVGFEELKNRAGLFLGQEGLDAEIRLHRDHVDISEYTPPRHEVVSKSKVKNKTTVTWEEEVYMAPVKVKVHRIEIPAQGGTLFIDGRITRLYGDLQGRLTVVGNEKVRITDSIRYIDGQGQTAMEHGNNYNQPYVRNAKYQGKSVLGVIARDDILFTSDMPKKAEINGTLVAVHGRVGIDGFWADDSGGLHPDSAGNRQDYLTEEQREVERAYDAAGTYGTEGFTKDSLRRIGGLVSNNRILETYITLDGQGLGNVSSGFERGDAQFDVNLLFNPPPNFIEIPRPVLSCFVPIQLERGHDS